MRQLRQDYTINIQVECIDTAIDIIRQLPGYNLDSSANFDRWHRSMEFRRRVSGDNFRYVQEILRGLGEVTFESESAAHLGTRIMDLDLRIAALNQELERLTTMMATSTTLEVLIAVNDRLSTVSRNRDELIGQLNVLQVESQGSIIHIYMFENLPYAPPPTPDSFRSRIADRFGSSIRNTRATTETFLVGVVGLALPLLIWAMILAAIGFVTWRLFGRKMWSKMKHKAEPKEAVE